jgi:hypothetical protein
MLEKVLIAVIAGAFCSMLTTIISILMAPKIFKVMIAEAVKQHTDIWHQDSMYKYVETAVGKHEESCLANNSIEEIRMAVIWLVEKQGGDIYKVMPKPKK